MNKKKPQINILTDYLIEHYPDEIETGGICDVAVKIIKNKEQKIENHVNKNSCLSKIAKELLDKKAEYKRIIRKLAVERKEFEKKIIFLSGCAYFAHNKHLPVDNPFGAKHYNSSLAPYTRDLMDEYDNREGKNECKT